MLIADAICRTPFLLGDLPLWAAEVYPTKPAIQSPSETLTYAALVQRVERRANALSRAGVSRFRRWGLLYGNSPDLIVSILALLRLGAVAALLGKRFPAERVQLLAQHARLDGVLFPAAGVEHRSFDRTFDGWTISHIDDETCARTLSTTPPRPPRSRIRAIDLDPALIVFTSGSTGAMKGVVLQHHAVLANIRSNVCELQYRDHDKTLVVLPIVHAYALVHQIFAHLLIGATTFIPSPPITPAELRRRLIEEQITTLALAPPLVPTLLNALGACGTPTDLRLVTIGAARTPPELLSELVRRLPGTRVALTYGLTEAGPRVATRFVEQSPHADEGIGRPLPNVEFYLESLTDGTAELIVRSRSLWRGPAEAPYPEGRDGELRTGDLAVVESGVTRLLGRLRRSLNRGGVLVGPAEIEAVLRHHPAVADALVIGEADQVMGEIPVAVICLRPGQAAGSSELRRHCEALLAPQELPGRFLYVDRIDRDARKAEMMASQLTWQSPLCTHGSDVTLG